MSTRYSRESSADMLQNGAWVIDSGCAPSIRSLRLAVLYRLFVCVFLSHVANQRQFKIITAVRLYCSIDQARHITEKYDHVKQPQDTAKLAQSGKSQHDREDSEQYHEPYENDYCRHVIKN